MPFQQNDKPDSVPPKICIVPAVPIPNDWVANIINLHSVLPQSVKPPTRFRFGTNHWKPIWGCCTQRLPVSLKPFGSHRHCCSNRQIALPGRLAGVLSHAVRTFLRQCMSAMLCLADGCILQQKNCFANIF